MSATVESTSASASGSPKSSKSKTEKAVKPKATHPSTAKMVETAIAALNEKNGSSVQAIKKYVIATYLLDPTKSNKIIAKYLKKATTDGTLVQTKGVGASGSFKLPSKTAKNTTKSEKVEKKTNKASPKKAATKKEKTAKVIKTAAKPKAKKLESSPVKSTKSPVKKPKAAQAKPATVSKRRVASKQ